MTAIIHTAAYDSAATYPLHHARIGYQSHARGLPTSAVTVTSEQASFPKDAPLREDTFESWKPIGGGSWTVDLGSAKSVDYVGIMGNMAGVTVTVEYSTDNIAWLAFSDANAVTANGPLLFLDAEKTARYWRVTFSAEASMASIYIGQVLEMQRSFFDGFKPLSLSRNTERRSAMSRGGQFIGQDIVSTGYSGSMPWRNLSPSWYRENFDPLVKHLRTLPIFAAWNIRDYGDDLVYAWSPDDIAPAQEAKTPGGLYSVSINLMGVGISE